MDHIYKTRDYKVYSVKKSVEELSTAVLQPDLPKNIEDIQRRSQLSPEDFQKMQSDIQNCYVNFSESDFNTEVNINEVAPYDSFSKEALSLNVIRFLRDEKVHKKVNEKHQENRRRYGSKIKEIVYENNPNPSDPEPYKEAVITVRFYVPFKHGRDKRTNPRFHQEFQVLSSQYLTELRDKIYCRCNYGPFFDISENPEAIPDCKGVDLVNPGFFFIHDTIYNDTRIEDNPDYSEIILKWAEKFSYMMKLKSAKMEETKFEDLQLRVGYPSVYQHHGACEHVFCITDIELLSQVHNLNRSDYPMLVESSQNRTNSCHMCGKRDIVYVIKDCPMHVENPFKVCEECFYSYHYVDGQKMFPFSAYKYYGVRP